MIFTPGFLKEFVKVSFVRFGEMRRREATERAQGIVGNFTKKLEEKEVIAEVFEGATRFFEEAECFFEEAASLFD